MAIPVHIVLSHNENIINFLNRQLVALSAGQRPGLGGAELAGYQRRRIEVIYIIVGNLNLLQRLLY